MGLTPPLLATFLASGPALLAGAVITAYGAAQALLILYACQRWTLLTGLRRRPDGAALPSDAGPPRRRVTVQLPVYNEPEVVERLVDAAASLDYPRTLFEIQVLDDSTDETSAIAARAVRHHRRRGMDVRHLRRERRDGHKAGALAAGLAVARGELIAVFDADFVPPPDFLRRVLPAFDDPRIGMVQARWGHLNRDSSWLTRAQAAILDAHFLIEHRARMLGGRFFNFNGSAGVWRRACIEDAGGWSADTLTEDLDLSYRAQLRGWRFRFVPDVVAKGELPAAVSALKSQQRRWARGSVQTARKLLPRILGARLPWPVRIEALFHLTGNAAYLLVLLLGLLLAPATWATGAIPLWTLVLSQAGVLGLGVAPAVLFLVAGQRAAGRAAREIARDVPLAVLLGLGLSFNNARAVLEGLRAEAGAWVRTPKTGDRGGARPAGRTPRARPALPELLLALHFAVVAIALAGSGHLHAVPFAALLVAGFGGLSLGARQVRGPCRDPERSRP